MVKISCNDGEGATVTCPNGDVIYIRYMRHNGRGGIGIAAPSEYRIDRKKRNEEVVRP